MGGAAFWNQKREAGEEEAEGHHGESRQKQVSSAKGVDRVERGNGEEEVNDTPSHGCAERAELREVGFDEDLGGVIGDHVHAAELLHEHDYLGRDHCTAVTGNTDHFPDFALALCCGFFFGLDQELDVEEITSCLDFVETESLDCVPGLGMSVLADIPTWRFRAQEDETAHDNGGHHGGCHHQPPVQALDVGRIGNSVEGKVCSVSDHDTESSPHLPLHDQSSTNRRRTCFGGVNGNRG